MPKDDDQQTFVFPEKPTTESVTIPQVEGTALRLVDGSIAATKAKAADEGDLSENGS